MTAGGKPILGLAAESGVGSVLNLALDGTVTLEQGLPGSHDLLRVIAKTSDAGDMHAAWINGARMLNYWLHHPAFGWHVVSVPVSVSTAGLSVAAGNDFRFALGPTSELPWFLTSRGTGGVINGAQLAVSYPSGLQWFTVFLDQALGIDWRDGGFTLGSMLMASMALESGNRCHVVWQEFDPDPTGSGLRIRHVVLSPVASATLDVDRRVAGVPGIRMEVPAVVRAGLVQVQLWSEVQLAGTPGRLEVIDASGRRVWGDRIVTTASNTVVADLTSSRPGLYFVRFEVAGRQLVSRFSILR